MRLILEDGFALTGQSFGAPCDAYGEVVFNTGMAGYVETLTDPSYKGQILVLTYPLVGNYGVPKEPYEAPRIQVQGLIISHYTEQPSHHSSVKSLAKWLKSEGIPALCHVDTRTLTRHLRAHGTLHGRIDLKGEEGARIEMPSVLQLVAPESTKRFGRGDVTILLIDTGSKENIVRCLVDRGAEVIRAPWMSAWESYLDEVDAVFLTNGPGDPMDAPLLIDRVRALLNKDLPIFGICFGHQILSLAAGARTSKMKFGNRSVNQPVQDLRTGRCYITSQNHGYVVETDTLSDDWEPWFINLNDRSNEGIRHLSKPFCSVQFHPEARPGPNDTLFLFDAFLDVVRAQKGKAHARETTTPETSESEVWAG